MSTSLAFGPVPSRRLGGSNAAPPRKTAFYPPEDIVAAARELLQETLERGETVDYLTIVPDGEPTLDTNLTEIIAGLKGLGPRTAIISNASLIGDPAVRAALSQLDWVSLKADAADEDTWKKVDRPHRDLQLEVIQQGMLTFRQDFGGTLATETMLIDGVNDSAEQVGRTAAFLKTLGPDVSYLSIPTRPPAVESVHAANEHALNRVFQSFAAAGLRTEWLIGYEGDAFAAGGDAEEDLLSITAVHPMRGEAVEELLTRDGATWDVPARLISLGKLVELDYEGHQFFMRRLPSRH